MHMAVCYDHYDQCEDSAILIMICQAFYNPSANGGIERTGRAADVTASTARFPFEVSQSLDRHY